MKLSIVLTLAFVLLTACGGPVVNTAGPAATVALPADVQDLAKPKTPRVANTASVETKAASITATGELISPMRSQVAPKQPGRVCGVFVREGEHVRKGQPLAAFETEYLLLDLQRAEAELARAKAMESDAARDLERKRELVATESVSRATFDRVQSTWESAVAARRAATAIVATTHQRIADATLRAPFDGVVETRSIAVGEHVGDGQAAFVLAETAKLKLRFRLPEAYLERVREGQRVNVTTDASAAGAFTAHITMIGGVIDPATRTLIAEADVDNSDGALKPGMFARVSIAR
jgi:RND family efflux transporter MFP subunit